MWHEQQQSRKKNQSPLCWRKVIGQLLNRIEVTPRKLVPPLFLLSNLVVDFLAQHANSSLAGTKSWKGSLFFEKPPFPLNKYTPLWTFFDCCTVPLHREQNWIHSHIRLVLHKDPILGHSGMQGIYHFWTGIWHKGCIRPVGLGKNHAWSHCQKAAQHWARAHLQIRPKARQTIGSVSEQGDSMNGISCLMLHRHSSHYF